MKSRVGTIARGLLDASWGLASRRAARAYVAGPELEDALRLCSGLEQAGMGSTLGRWNAREEAPRAVADAYLCAVEAIAREGLNAHLAIKGHALGLSRELCAEVATRAAAAGVPVRLDAQAFRFAEPIMAIAADLAPRVPWLGVALPGRWPRSLADADRAVELGLPVRVVKGEYPDPAAADADRRAGFLEVVGRLAGRARHVAVATHDAPLAREALRCLQQAGTPCSLELLLGLPFSAALREGIHAAVPVRVYVPYGVPSVPYHYTGMRRDPRIVSWLIQDLLFKEAFRLPRSFPTA